MGPCHAAKAQTSPRCQGMGKHDTEREVTRRGRQHGEGTATHGVLLSQTLQGWGSGGGRNTLGSATSRGWPPAQPLVYGQREPGWQRGPAPSAPHPSPPAPCLNPAPTTRAPEAETPLCAHQTLTPCREGASQLPGWESPPPQPGGCGGLPPGARTPQGFAGRSSPTLPRPLQAVFGGTAALGATRTPHMGDPLVCHPREMQGTGRGDTPGSLGAVGGSPRASGSAQQKLLPELARDVLGEEIHAGNPVSGD